MSKRSSSLLLLLLCLLFSCSEQDSAGSTRSDENAASQSPAAQLRETPTFSGENAYVHCGNLCALGPRPSGSVTYREQLNYLTKYLQQYGWRVNEQSFKLSNGHGMSNLHAVFGESSSPRPILITCHIDTKIGIGKNFVGADDGASAAAVMIELAHILAATPEAASDVELVFYDGEEAFGRHMTHQDGLYGSRYDIARRGSQLPLYQINLDMVGGRNKTIAVPLMDTSETMLSVYEQAVSELNFSNRRWTVHPGSYLDDHTPFVEADVDSLNLIADFTNSNWWHTEKDNMSRICPKSLAETGRLVLQLITLLRK